MSIPQDAASVVYPEDLRGVVVRTTGGVLAALEQLIGGFGTAVLALVVLVQVLVTAVLCLVGVRLLMVPGSLRAVRAVADRERARLGRWGAEVVRSDSVATTLRGAAADPVVRREPGWLTGHASAGLGLGLLGVALPVYAVRDVCVVLWWWLLPEEIETSLLGGGADNWPEVGLVTLLGLGWIAIVVTLTPGLARLQAWPGRRLLGPVPGTDLSLWVTQLTATRAGALDAHAAELRRIERSLHDGTQNRLVAVTVLIGAARRAMTRDPAGAEDLLERGGAGARGAARGRPRHPAAGPGRSGARRRAGRAGGGLPGPVPGGRRRPGAVPVGGGHRILRGRGGADQRRPAQPRPGRDGDPPTPQRAPLSGQEGGEQDPPRVGVRLVGALHAVPRDDHPHERLLHEVLRGGRVSEASPVST